MIKKNILFISPYSRQLFYDYSLLPFGGSEIKAFNIAHILKKTYSIKYLIHHPNKKQNTILSNKINGIELLELNIIGINQEKIDFIENFLNKIKHIVLNISSIRIKKVIGRSIFFSKMTYALFKFFLKIKKKTFFRKILLRTSYKFLNQLLIKNKDKIFNDIDVIFIFGNNELSYFISEISKKKKIKTILFIGSDYDVSDEILYSKKKIGNYGLVIDDIRNTLKKNIDKIIVQNDFQYKQIENFKNFNNKNILKLVNPLPKFENMIIDTKKIYDCIWVGKFDEIKNPIVFSKIANKLINLKFLIIAQYSSSETLKELIEIKPPNLEIVIFPSRAESMNYLSQSKMIVNTSIFEGFPNVFLEALSLKTYIVSLNVNPNSIFNKYKFGKCFNGKLNDMIKFIKKNISNESLFDIAFKDSVHYFKINHKDYSTKIINFINN